MNRIINSLLKLIQYITLFIYYLIYNLISYRKGLDTFLTEIYDFYMDTGKSPIDYKQIKTNKVIIGIYTDNKLVSINKLKYESAIRKLDVDFFITALIFFTFMLKDRILYIKHNNI